MPSWSHRVETAVELAKTVPSQTQWAWQQRGVGEWQGIATDRNLHLSWRSLERELRRCSLLSSITDVRWHFGHGQMMVCYSKRPESTDERKDELIHASRMMDTSRDFVPLTELSCLLRLPDNQVVPDQDVALLSQVAALMHHRLALPTMTDEDDDPVVRLVAGSVDGRVPYQLTCHPTHVVSIYDLRALSSEETAYLSDLRVDFERSALDALCLSRTKPLTQVSISHMQYAFAAANRKRPVETRDSSQAQPRL